MKLNIYSVIEKTPPIDEDLILWTIDENEVVDFKFVEAYIAIPEDEEERALIPNECHKEMIWSNGYNMRLDDKWSHVAVSKDDK